MAYLISWRKRECWAWLRWHSLCCIKPPWSPFIRSWRTCRWFTALRRFLTFCCVARTSLPSRKKFSLLADWKRCKVAIVSSCVFRIWSTSWDKLLVSSHKLKIETTVHAASFNGSPRINPAPAAIAAIAPISLFERGSVATSLCYCFGRKDFITSASFSCSSVACFTSNLINLTRSFNCVIKRPYVSLTSWNSQTFWTYMPPIPVIRVFARFNKSSAPVKLTSGIFWNGENTRTLLSLSEVTAWYLKRKAAPFLKTGTSGWSLRWVE